MSDASERPGIQPLDDRNTQVAKVVATCLHRRTQGEELTDQEIIREYAELMPELAEQLRYLDLVLSSQEQSPEESNLPSTIRGKDDSTAAQLVVQCPHCQEEIKLNEEDNCDRVICPACHHSFGLLINESDPTELQPGQTIGRFELVRHIGQGGFAAVWEARDPQLERTVALKVPRWGRPSAAEAEMFLREARAAAQIRHPNIVAIHEVGRDGDLFYLVCDFIDGESLERRLLDRQLSEGEAIRLVETIAGALHAVHEFGVIHRDLKPGNILIDQSGQPYLADFGLARRESHELTMTLDGHVLGTPAYMSPEQAKGDSHNVDRRCDIYALGTVLYELLAGDVPFRGQPQAILQRVVRDEPTSPRRLNPAVSKDLETITLKCLEKQPIHRYQTAADLAAELARCRRREPITARPISLPARLTRWARRKPAVAALSASLATVLILATIVSTWFALHAKSSLALAERRVYAAEMNRVQEAIDRGNPVAAREILEAFVPKDGEIDHRMWEWYYLHSRSASQEVAVRMSNAKGRAVAYAPDGKRIAWGDFDGRAYVSDHQLKAVRELRGSHEEMINSIDFSVDGSTIATASDDGTVRLWDAGTCELVETWELGDETKVWHAGYWHEGTSLVALCQDPCELVIRETDSKEITDRVSLTQGDYFKLSLFPDGRHFAISLRRKTDGRFCTQLYDLQGEGPLWTKPAGRIACSPLGDSLVLAWRNLGQDQKLEFCEPLTGERQKLVTLRSFTGTIVRIKFTPDGKRVVAAGDTGTTVVLGAETHQILRTYSGHRDRIMDISCSPEVTHFASVGDDQSVRVWDLRESFESKNPGAIELDAGISQLEFSPDGTQLVVNVFKREVALSELIIFSIPGLAQLQGTASDVRWNQIGGFLGNDHSLLIGSTLHGIALWRPPSLPETVLYEPKMADGIGALAISPDGQRMGYSIPRNTTAFPGDPVTYVISPLVGSDKSLRLGGSEPSTHRSQVLRATFSPDGTRIATIGRERSLMVWDAANGHLIYTCQEDSVAGPVDVAISPDSRLIATGASTGLILVRRFDDGRELVRFRHDGNVSGVKFMPNSETLVTASFDKTIRLWDIPTAQLRTTLRKHETGIRALAVSADGKFIASGDMKGKLYLWKSESPE